jgi:rRNA-processing protein CGR1
MDVQATTIIKGQNVSGRGWKTKPQKRASSLIKTKVNNLRTTWEQKQAERQTRQEALTLQKELKEQKRQEAIEKKERRLENEKRRAENEYKVIQKSAQTLNVGKVGATLKSMSKKQLRQVKKTRMNQKTGVVEFVPAYAK